jgi:hypothetical protein
MGSPREKGRASLLWGDDHLDRSANESLTDDSTFGASLALDVTPREEEELQRLGSVGSVGSGREGEIDKADDPTLVQATCDILANEHCGHLQPVGCALAGVL